MNLRLPRRLIVALDEYRRGLSDMPTRPEVIRRLLSEWMFRKDRE